jgi:electron transfer flavoprotein beta subunit
MKIAVLISGVADPKRPIEMPPSRLWNDLISAPTTPFKLSPFDEAALEVALKMRDRNSDITAHVIVTDGSIDTALMKHIASYRPDSLIGLRILSEQRGDPRCLSQHVLKLIPADMHIDLWLTGREHGDLDDGVVPVTLAEKWKLPFLSLVLTVKKAEESDHSVLVERMANDRIESIQCPLPALLSISNDKSNRLRHPLMKNVMLAKQLAIDIRSPQDELMEPMLSEACPVSALMPTDIAARGQTPCKMITGSLEEQVQVLARHLDRWRQSGIKNFDA